MTSLKRWGLCFLHRLQKGEYILLSRNSEGTIYTGSGCGPEVNGHNFIGKLGSDFTVEEGQMAAKNCLLNLLANLDQYLGDLNRIQCFAKLLGFVNLYGFI